MYYINANSITIQSVICSSQPHFLNGDFYKDTVIGMSPDEALHNTFIDVEPVGGARHMTKPKADFRREAF